MKFCKCGAIIDGSCSKCEALTRQTTTQRGYGHDWQKLSRTIRSEQPLCIDCLAAGKVKPSTQVHHEIPISVDKTKRMDRSNLVPLCDDCHKGRHDGGPIFSDQPNMR
jgi:5-methylcytosine-specific restriction endonuclease McrA